MAATVAAVLLDREARSSLLDLEPTHGQLREPIIRVLHLMRSLEYAPTRPGLELNTDWLSDKIGQMVRQLRLCFGLFLAVSPAVHRPSRAVCRMCW